MNSSSSSSFFHELRNKRKFEKDDTEEAVEICKMSKSNIDVNANVSEDMSLISTSMRGNFLNFLNQRLLIPETTTKKAIWFKTDSMKIIPDKSKKNLCMFYSILNGLPTYDQKLAFTGGYTGSDPSTNFLRYNKLHSTRDHETLGFSASEMVDWLKYLKDESIIKEFVYKNLKQYKKKEKSILNKLFFSEEIRDENVLHLIEGWSPVYDNKNKIAMRSCLKGTMTDFVGIPSAEDYKSVEGSQRLLNMKIKVYELIGNNEDPAVSSFRSDAAYSHTISVRWSNEHNAMLIFDTEKSNVKKLESVEDFSKHLQCCIKVYAFALTI